MQTMPIHFMMPTPGGHALEISAGASVGRQSGIFEGMLLGITAGGQPVNQQGQTACRLHEGVGWNTTVVPETALSWGDLRNRLAELFPELQNAASGMSLVQIQECIESILEAHGQEPDQPVQPAGYAAGALVLPDGLTANTGVDAGGVRAFQPAGTAEAMYGHGIHDQSALDTLVHIFQTIMNTAGQNGEAVESYPFNGETHTDLRSLCVMLCRSLAAADGQSALHAATHETAESRAGTAREHNVQHAAQQVLAIIRHVIDLQAGGVSTACAEIDPSAAEQCIGLLRQSSRPQLNQREQTGRQEVGPTALTDAAGASQTIVTHAQFDLLNGRHTNNPLFDEGQQLPNNLSRTFVTNILQGFSAAKEVDQADISQIARNLYHNMTAKEQATPVVHDAGAGQNAVSPAVEHLQATLMRLDAHASAPKQADMPAVNSQYLIDQIAQRIASGMRRNENTITLDLHPPSLGKLHIDISVIDNQMRAVIIASSTQVKYALENSLDQLRSALQNHNIEVEKFSVQVEQDANQFAALLRDRAGQRHRKIMMPEIEGEEMPADARGISETIHHMNSRLSTGASGVNLFA